MARMPALAALAACALAVGPGAAHAQPRLLVIGDSLAFDSAAHLEAALAGWDVELRAWGGVRLATGMGWLAQERHPPPILAFGLFTNDPPDQGPAWERAVIHALTTVPGCHVWATAYRRSPRGNAYAAANRRLRALEGRYPGRLVVVDWAAWVVRAPGLVRADGVHDTPVGSWARAQLYAAAAHRCLHRRRRGRAGGTVQTAVREGRDAASRPSSRRSRP